MATMVVVVVNMVLVLGALMSVSLMAGMTGARTWRAGWSWRGVEARRTIARVVLEVVSSAAGEAMEEYQATLKISIVSAPGRKRPVCVSFAEGQARRKVEALGVGNGGLIAVVMQGAYGKGGARR